MSTTVTFQQGVSGYAGCADTFMYEGAATTNYDTFATLDLYNIAPPDRADALVAFDVSSIPAGATIVSATLRLITKARSGQSFNAVAYPLLVDFVKNQATYNIRKAATNWNTPCAKGAESDYTATNASAAVATNMTVGGATDFNVAAFIQAVVSGSVTNNGWVMRSVSAAAGNWVQFGQSEDATSSNRPSLTVEYTTGPNRKVLQSSFRRWRN